jgi:hypothetical protein
MARLGLERAGLEQVAMGKVPLLKGTLVVRYKVCGKPGCRCMKEGKKHGPYVYLSRSVGGKTRMVPVPGADRQRVKRLTEDYRKFRKARERAMKVARAMVELWNELEVLRTEEYPREAE